METFNEHNAFGFSLVSEQEVKKKEHELKDHLERYTSEVENLKTDLQSKLSGLIGEVMPLLSGLAENPEKDYIYWPGATRVEAINAFIKKINERYR